MNADKLVGYESYDGETNKDTLMLVLHRLAPLIVSVETNSDTLTLIQPIGNTRNIRLQRRERLCWLYPVLPSWTGIHKEWI